MEARRSRTGRGRRTGQYGGERDGRARDDGESVARAVATRRSQPVHAAVDSGRHQDAELGATPVRERAQHHALRHGGALGDAGLPRPRADGLAGTAVGHEPGRRP